MHYNLGEEDCEDKHTREGSASPHAPGGAPATLLGSICCSSQLQVTEAASRHESPKKEERQRHIKRLQLLMGIKEEGLKI